MEKKYAVIIGEVIVNKCLNKKLIINTSKLMKLMYFMQKLHLQKYGDIMYSEEIIATINGPCIQEINNFFLLGRMGFDEKIEQKIVLLDSHDDVANTILETYGKFNPSELMNLSFEDEAYKLVWENGRGENLPIPLGILANTGFPEKNKTIKKNMVIKK